MYGSFLFLGFVSGQPVFDGYMVLIIYYKQISEGFDDPTAFPFCRKWA